MRKTPSSMLAALMGGCVFISGAAMAQRVPEAKPVQDVADVSPVLKAVRTLQSVKAEGEGNAESAAAWKLLVEQPVSDLPLLLAGMANVHPVARNYLHSAAHALATRPGVTLPVPQLDAFLLNTQQDSVARKLCYDIILTQDASVRERVLPKLLKDPAAPLRREAVQRLMDLAVAAKGEGKKDVAVAKYEEALTGALEEEQVKKIAEELKDLGKEVDLLKHFGFITNWHVVGPFHNDGRAGFAEAFAVEPPKSIRFEDAYPGLGGEVKWKPTTVKDPTGLVLFNKELAEKKSVTAYAVTNFYAKDGGASQIRLGSKNAWKVWLNGELVFARDEYHRGRRIDQYILPVDLRQGPNQILVKCCQNEEVQTWTGEWQFQLRVTNLGGDAQVSQEPEVKKP